jgi:hypothetical protein
MILVKRLDRCVLVVAVLCLQVVRHNVELVQHFGGAVVDSVQQGVQPDASSHTAGLAPAMAGAGAGGGSHAGALQHQGNTHSVNHSAAGLKQRAAARAQDGVQMTQLRAGAGDVADE